MAKKLKDPNKPKKPLTAYFRYLADVRQKVKDENPGIKPAPLTKICGKMWSTLDVEKKKVYQDAAEIDNNEWKAKMVIYKKTPEFAEFEVKRKAYVAEQKKKDKKRKRKTPKDKNAPKKPATAFFLYSASVRGEVKQSMPEDQRNKVTLITKRIGVMWGVISAEEKAEWVEKGKTLRAEYKIKFAEYQKSPEYAAYQEILRAHKDKIQEDEQRERNRVKKQVTKRKKKRTQVMMPTRVLQSDSSDDEQQQQQNVGHIHHQYSGHMATEETEESESEESA